MKQRLYVAVVCAATMPAVVFACTAFFFDRNGERWLARNLDVPSNVGYIMVNKRDYLKTAYMPSDMTGQPAKWVSQYGSITFNQLSRDIPQGGMNEAGLVIEHLYLSSTQYPADPLPSVVPQQWVQYQLDTCSNVAEVVAQLDAVQILNWVFPVHFFVCDPNGDMAVIEFLSGNTVVYTNASMPDYMSGLANSQYALSASSAYGYKPFGGDLDLPTTPVSDSTKRFVYAVASVRDYCTNTTPPPIFAFCTGILDDIALGPKTVRIQWDLARRIIYHATSPSMAWRMLRFDDHDFSPSSPSMVLRFGDDATTPTNWVPYTTALNRAMTCGFCEEVQAIFPQLGSYSNQLAVYPESNAPRPWISALAVNGTDVTMTWPGSLGQRYVVQSCTNLMCLDWTNSSAVIEGTPWGTNITTNVVAPTRQGFFRLLVEW